MTSAKSRATRTRSTLATASTFGIPAGVVFALAVRLLGALLERLSHAYPLVNIWWNWVDFVRQVRELVVAVLTYRYTKSYQLHEFMGSGLGIWMALAFCWAVHLFCFSKKRT